MSQLRAEPLVVCGLVLLAYSSSLGGGFVYDDRWFIQENPLIRDLANLPGLFTMSYWEASSFPVGLYYRPLVLVSYALNHSFGGHAPLGYHLVNVGLHLANTALVFALARALSGRVQLAAAVALLFGLHPINTEAVAWISGRGDLLATLFFLGALLPFVLLDPPEPSRTPKLRSLPLVVGWSLLSFLLGLFAKESIATLLGVLVLYQLTFSRQRKAAFRLIPFVGVLAVYLGARLMLTGGFAGFATPFDANPLVEESAWPRLLTGIVLFGKYLSLLLFPDHLSVDYSYNQIPIARTLWDLRVVLSALAGLGVLALWVASWRRDRTVFFGLGFFLASGALIFANALVPFTSIMGERFMYLPSIGFVLAVVGMAAYLAERLPSRTGTLALTLGTIVLAGSFSVRTWSRNLDWRDDFTLFRSAVAVSPDSVIVRGNLAHQYLRRGEFGPARENYRRAAEIHPEYAPAHIGLGEVALGERRYAEALEHLSHGEALLPGLDRVHVSLGVAYKGLGRLDEAQAEYEAARDLNPKNPQIYNNLANLFLLKGDLPRAFELWEQTLSIDPSSAEALFNLGYHHERAGDEEEARRYYRRFLEVAPDRFEDLKEKVRRKLGVQ
jgi:Flp pilus assembly protein TadD